MRALFVFLVACGQVATLPQPDAGTDASSDASARSCGVVAPALAPKCNVRWGNGHYQNPRSVFMASNGDMIVTAEFQETITIASHAITPTDTNDSTFVARFDSNCDIVWIRTISGSAQATAALPNDRLALMMANAGGHALLEIDFGGADIWSRSLSASGSINTLGTVAVTSDEAGSVYFAGILQGSTDLGTGIIGLDDLSDTQYVAKVDASGKTVFAIARDYAAPTGLAVNAAGLWMSGLFVDQAPVNFDGNVLAPTSPIDPASDGLESSFFVRLSLATGAFIDGAVFEHEKLWTVQADRCTQDLTTSGSSSGVRAGVIARYDGVGHRVWTRQGEASAELVDGAGNLLVATAVTPGFGFAVYDLDGSLVFERMLAKTNADVWTTAMAIASTGSVVLLGNAQAPSIDFGLGPLTGELDAASPGTEDGFLLRLE